MHAKIDFFMGLNFTLNILLNWLGDLVRHINFLLPFPTGVTDIILLLTNDFELLKQRNCQ